MTTPPQSPRPDQRLTGGPGGAPGSRSGSGELAGAFGYPGVPPAVPNCLGGSVFQNAVGFQLIVTMPQAGRVWMVALSYVITSNNSFAPATARTIARIETVTAALPLMPIQLGVAGPNQHDSDTQAVVLPGLPVVEGEVIRLNVNNGNVIPNLDQQASAVVLYSIP